MNLHELCKAYRKGHQWYIFDGSKEATSTCRTGVFSAIGMKPVNDVPNGNHWQIWREISFRILGTEPFNWSTPVNDSVDELHNISAEDMVTIGRCIAKTYKQCCS